MVKNLVITGLAVLVVVFGISALGVNFGATPGTDHYNAQTFLNTVTFNGALTSDAGLTLSNGTDGTTGTALNQYKVYTNSAFNPAEVSSSTAAATLAFLTPYVDAGDLIVATVATTTSPELWRVDAKVTAGSGTATATTTLYLYGVEGAAVNLSTTTATLKIFN